MTAARQPKAARGSPWVRYGAIFILSLAPMMLTACDTTTVPGGIDLGDYQDPPRDLIGIASTGGSHAIRLAGRSGQLTTAEREKLAGFIGDIGANRPESLRVALHGQAGTGQLKAIADELIGLGVDPNHIARSSWEFGPPPPRGMIDVLVERPIAIPPRCPGWVSHVSAPADNLTSPNFGCANAANLAVMIADPMHLRHGASSIHHDGERGAENVTAYRTDKVKELPKLGTTFTVK
jgi:pilus assembly protein CpaD